MVLLILFLHGIGIPLIMLSHTSIIQKYSPSHYQGRIFSLVHLGVVGTTVISSSLVGIISSIISVQPLFFAIEVGETLFRLLALVMISLRQLSSIFS